MRKTGAELLTSGERFAVTMWEYSWMVQRSGLQAEYADWDRVLDELVERGYNCIRIDAHPHLLAAGPNGSVANQFTMLPIDARFMWGNHKAVTVNPRQDVIEFMQKAKARGIYVGLSSWYNDDTTHRKLMVRSPADYVRIWQETLDLIDAAGLLDCVVWVDVCNEFPLPSWALEPYKAIFDQKKVATGLTAGMWRLAPGWSQSAITRFGEYLTESVQGLKCRYPHLRYTFSFQGIGSSSVVKADASALDLGEPHIWSTDDLWWMFRSGMLKSQGQDPLKGMATYARQAVRNYPRYRARCRRVLEQRMDFWKSWAARYKLPLVTTEGWTAVLYEDISPNGQAGEWAWFKDVAEYAVETALRKGWQGICTSNFCEPHFEGMWKDVAWHRRLTTMIRSD